MSSITTGSTTGAVDLELNLGRLLDRNPQLQIPRDEYNINVTSNEGDRLDSEELAREYGAFPGAGHPAHLYFHLPLCNYICHFCNYVKRLVPRGKEDPSLRLWSDLLIEESRRYLDRFDWIPQARIESFYIGGGTAALLLNSPEYIEPLVRHARENYDLSDNVEFNIEGNPENFQRHHLETAQELGFNRFSLGVQSLQDEVNDFTKRRHSAAQSIEAIENLLATGSPFNVDMMFGLPYQTPESVRRDMTILTDLGVPTITIYRLRNADREEMGIGNRAVWNNPAVRERLISEGRFPDLDSTYAMRQEAVEVLLEKGYYPSPCGWWSRPGTYEDGNIPQTSKNKWEHYNTMIAYGPGAYGWLTGDQEEFLQTHNITDIGKYVSFMQKNEGLPLNFGRRLSGHKAIGTALGFNFKANQPIVLERYRARFGADLMETEPFASAFAELLERGLVEMVGDGTALKPTLDGEALHEEIIFHYFHQRIGLSDAPVCRR
ncbi:radical SAM protein [Streptomyces sp. NPDC085596]|uniref:radical SAM protein n=1 Tax=Streptomyces sp. NPDC085596 TaxID=3365731 RepID=UPI0037D5836D